MCADKICAEANTILNVDSLNRAESFFVWISNKNLDGIRLA